MKAFKILLKEIKQENKWGYTEKGIVRKGVVVLPYKNEEIELKKGDIIYFQDDYVKEFNEPDICKDDIISTNPTNLVCQK